jgi:hypothetical protein
MKGLSEMEFIRAPVVQNGTRFDFCEQKIRVFYIVMISVTSNTGSMIGLGFGL